ncbi:MAG: VanW family protein [Clostridia bacterium]|nr:VanW family protein [Clostridia bacterium]
MGNIESRENSWSLALQYQGHTFTTLNYAVMGVHTDREQVRQLLDEAYAIGHTGDEDQRLRALEQASDQETAFYTTESEMTDANVDSVLNQIATYFEKSPRDARLISFEPDNNDPFVIQDDVSGSHLNTTAAKQEILRRAAAGDSGVFELTPEEVPAAITTADIRKQVTLLSEGITKIATTSPEGRNSNIRLSMEKINGTVLKSGQTFSFNSVVGRRTAEAGFVEAIEYLYGKEVPGVGGGVCQASTTVYLAAVTANLQITKRSPHSMKVSYTELGQDATVSGTRIDLEFKNNSGGTIYITAKMEYQPKTTKRYQCVVRIYGPSLGEGVRYQLRSETTDVLFPGDPVLMKDTAGTYVTYEDEMYQYQTGRDGYVIDTYLQRVENGQVTSETLISTDTYKAQPDGYYVGVTRRDDNYY